MSNTCLKPLPSNIGDELTSTYGAEYKKMISGMETLTTSCPTKGGKSKRSRRTKREEICFQPKHLNILHMLFLL